jgi:hypothetical protein
MIAACLILLVLANDLLGFVPDDRQCAEDTSFGNVTTKLPPQVQDGRRFLFASMHSTLGFGDQMRWYYDQLLIAKLLGRVLVLPDMHWARQHYDAAAQENPLELAAVRAL